MPVTKVKPIDADVEIAGTLTVAGGMNVTELRDDAANDGKVLTVQPDGTIAAEAPAGASLARSAVAFATASLAADASEAGSVVLGKSSVALVLQTSAAAWVRFYVTAAARDADVGRDIADDPLPGAGVLLDVLTASSVLTQPLSPPILLFNDDGTPTTDIYYNVTNKSGSTAAITVTLTRIPLE